MMRLAALVSLFAWIFISCKGGSASPVEDKSKIDPPIEQTNILDSKSKRSPDLGTVKGEVSVKRGEDGEEDTGTLILKSKPGMGVEGSFHLLENEYQLRGIRESESIRLWVSQKNEGLGAAQKGAMTGTIHDNNYVGTFSISGNGGEPKISGTWKSSGILGR